MTDITTLRQQLAAAEAAEAAEQQRIRDHIDAVEQQRKRDVLAHIQSIETTVVDRMKAPYEAVQNAALDGDLTAAYREWVEWRALRMARITMRNEANNLARSLQLEEPYASLMDSEHGGMEFVDILSTSSHRAIGNRAEDFVEEHTHPQITTAEEADAYLAERR